jgi:hypothetical protein
VAVKILDAASLPMKFGPNRIVFLVWGLGAGMLAAVPIRWPRGAWQLALFAVGGCVLAGGASELIPNRFTSTAVMSIFPAAITEDPLAPLPEVTPVAEFLRQTEPELLSFQSLSRIIDDPRLNLYPNERATRPMDEVVRNMVANDLRIAPLGPASATKGADPAFRISFSYSDRYKAQATVQALMNRFDELNQVLAKRRAEASGSVMLRAITQRKAGEGLDVLDTASLPTSPSNWPNRLTIAVGGFFVGLLVGAIRLVRRPRAPSAGENAYAT